MADTLEDRLDRILPDGKGVWIPMDHGASHYPEQGLEDMDSLVEKVISGGADAIVLHKGALTHHVDETGWHGFVCHVSASTTHGGKRDQYRSPSPPLRSAGSAERWEYLDRSTSATRLSRR